MTSVRLEPITERNVKAVFDLEVAPGQEAYVASNPWSLAQALAEHHIAWPRAIVAADAVVGLLMLEIDPDRADGRTFRLWRLMIAADRQREGIGTAALRLALDEVRSRGGTEIYTGWVPGDRSPGPFYERLGFVPTASSPARRSWRASLSAARAPSAQQLATSRGE